MIIFDLETQSFPVESGIYEVACLAIENYEIVDKLYLGIPIEGYQGSTRFGYGFRDISLNQGAIREFQEFTGRYRYPLVAHNCPFDKKFLEYYHWATKELEFYCSMRAIKHQAPGLDSYSLGKLIRHFGVGSDASHTAFEDVTSLLAVLRLVKPETWFKVGESRRGFSNTSTPIDIENLKSKYNFSAVLQGEVICFTGKSTFTRKKNAGNCDY
ncbi:3'-5' exonuclease [Listeria floridensis]|nr:3'-5' exonuclease [Listeria floridensis]